MKYLFAQVLWFKFAGFFHFPVLFYMNIFYTHGNLRWRAGNIKAPLLFINTAGWTMKKEASYGMSRRRILVTCQGDHLCMPNRNFTDALIWCDAGYWSSHQERFLLDFADVCKSYSCYRRTTWDVWNLAASEARVTCSQKQIQSSR